VCRRITPWAKIMSRVTIEELKETDNYKSLLVTLSKASHSFADIRK
jgi:hypothetical protein